MKAMKKIFFTLLVFCLITTIVPQPVTVNACSQKLTFTAKTSGIGNAVLVKKVKFDTNVHDDPYIGNTSGSLSELEVKFLSHVTWKRTAKISSIKDNKGSSYKGYLTDKESDECEILISNIKYGRTYTIIIDGIKKSGTIGSYRKLTLKVTLPAKKASSKTVTVSKVKIDEDGEYGSPEIDVKFATKVSWKNNAKVSSVKDDKGITYQGYLIDRDDDDCEIFINNIEYGRTYTIKISGIKARGASSYETITITAKIPAESSGIIVKKVEYDVDYEYYGIEHTVSFDFNKKISHKNSSYVLITDENGKSYSSESSFVEWDGDECEVHLSEELTIGKLYHYQIVDISAKGKNKYTTLTGSFVAYHD